MVLNSKMNRAFGKKAIGAWSTDRYLVMRMAMYACILSLSFVISFKAMPVGGARCLFFGKPRLGACQILLTPGSASTKETEHKQRVNDSKVPRRCPTRSGSFIHCQAMPDDKVNGLNASIGVHPRKMLLLESTLENSWATSPHTGP